MVFPPFVHQLERQKPRKRTRKVQDELGWGGVRCVLATGISNGWTIR